MPVAAIVTVVLVGVLVAALAFYLIWVVLLLRRVHHTLGKVTFGVRAIAYRTTPIGPTVAAINVDLDAVAGALEELGARLSGPPAEARGS